MTKVRRISEFQHKILFNSIEDNMELYRLRFLASDLGKIYTAIPFDALVKESSGSVHKSVSVSSYTILSIKQV